MKIINFLSLITISFFSFSCQLAPREVILEPGYSYDYPASGGTKTVVSKNGPVGFGIGETDGEDIIPSTELSSTFGDVTLNEDESLMPTYESYGWIKLCEIKNTDLYINSFFIKVLPNDNGKERSMSIVISDSINGSVKILVRQSGN